MMRRNRSAILELLIVSEQSGDGKGYTLVGYTLEKLMDVRYS